MGFVLFLKKKMKGQKMILIIDDNEDLANAFSEYLNMVGYKSVALYNGQEGIDKAKEIKPKLILCDIGMKKISGYDVAQFIRQDKELKDTYLIAISGYSTQRDVESSIEAGFDMHLCKPINLEDLRDVIEKALKSKE